MTRIKKILKKILPDSFIRFASGLHYGWHGNYSSWDKAVKKCTGYDSQIIFDRVKASALMVKDGSAAYERDSVIFDEVDYTFPLLSSLLWIAAQNQGKLNVLDFGGSLGSTYFQNKFFLDALPSVNWCIVEQSGFVKAGNETFEDGRLHFFYTIEECLRNYKPDVILLSSVLQYIDEPYNLLDKIKSTGVRYLIIDRTPFIKGPDRITVQKVNPKIYKADYPCWFFNEEKFVSYLNRDYKLILEFDALDRANIKSQFKGFVFQNLK